MPDPILEIRLQYAGYSCAVCSAYVPEGRWCLLVRGEGCGVIVCKACHDAHPAGEIEVWNLP